MYFLYPCHFSWCVAVIIISRHDRFLPLGLKECASLIYLCVQRFFLEREETPHGVGSIGHSFSKNVYSMYRNRIRYCFICAWVARIIIGEILIYRFFMICQTPIQLLELTVPQNTCDGLQTVCERKQTELNFIALVNYLENMGFVANPDTLEVGFLGHFAKEAIATLHATLPNLISRAISGLLLELSKIAVCCSSQIFQARRCTT